ncbi:unnamed protein product [Ilex paraguariensis]|uniref:FRIGIDA-like protein n=1 Tax=Ilex paraguariensis TaxID=185542 RepID=A0ABC8V2V3_9AQUA
MGSIADPGELTQPSFDEFQRQTSLMTSCTLLWKELSDHFTSLEQDLQKKFKANDTVPEPEVDDSDGLLMKLKSFCVKMDSLGFWKFVVVRKKELDIMRTKMPVALGDCVDPARFVLEAISEVFPVDKREVKIKRVNDLGWACVLLLESLIPVMDVGDAEREGRAKEIAETWKKSLEEMGGIENVKTPDVHTFLQHLVTFGIVKKEDVELYRKLVVGSAWRKQMPKLAVSLGLGDKMPGMFPFLLICFLLDKGFVVSSLYLEHHRRLEKEH